jgi:hypothetical protein
VLDREVPPGPQDLEAVQRHHHRLPAAHNGLALVINDRLEQGFLVLEAMIDLRAAHPGSHRTSSMIVPKTLPSDMSCAAAATI